MMQNTADCKIMISRKYVPELKKALKGGVS